MKLKEHIFSVVLDCSEQVREAEDDKVTRWAILICMLCLITSDGFQIFLEGLINNIVID